MLFAKEVNSKTAEIGDKIPMILANDLVVNGNVVARQGARLASQSFRRTKPEPAALRAISNSKSIPCKPTLAF